MPGLTPAIAKALVAARPFDNITALNTFLLGQKLTQEQANALYRQMFVHINLNTATAAEIMLIPGAGKRMAHEFEEYRPWRSYAQFDKEIGKYVDAKEVARLAQYTFIPLNLNTATEADFMTIPGVGKRMAHEFDEYRPWKTQAQFEKEIGKYVDAKEVKRLWRYVYSPAVQQPATGAGLLGARSSSDAGARHRRHDRDVLRRRCGPAAPAAVSRRSNAFAEIQASQPGPIQSSGVPGTAIAACCGKNSAIIAAVEGFRMGSATITGGREPDIVGSPSISPNLLSLVGATPHLGRLFTDGDLSSTSRERHHQSSVVEHELRRRGGHYRPRHRRSTTSRIP